MIEPYEDGAEHDPTKWWTDPAVQKALRDGSNNVESGPHRCGHLIRAGSDLIMIQSVSGEPLRRHVKRSVYPGAVVSDINGALSVRIDSEGPPLSPIDVRLDQLSAQLNMLNGHVTEMLNFQQQAEIAGIGHNNPPPDGGNPLNDVLKSITEIKVELAKPVPLAGANTAIIEKAEERFTKFLAWFRDRVKEAPTLLVQGTITGAGALLLNYAVANQAEIVTTASTLSQTVSDWAVHLNPPF